MMTVRKTSVFPATKKEVFKRLQRLKTLQYIAYPFATFTPVNGNNKQIWKEGTVSAYKFKLFGFIPFGVHTIEDITIKTVRTQEQLKNLQGRSAILDVHAVDSTKKEFDVEIQRSDVGAGAKRARHNSSLLDAHILKPGDDTEDIPDSYVIFITENDVMKGNQPIYPVERYVIVGENKVLFDDGSHIIYVNGKYRGNDEIGKLMHDFSCTNPDDMNYEALAKKARYYKQDEKGVAAMCKIMEDMRNEAALDNARETARRMIKKGKMSLEEIADYVPVLSLDELKQLETEIMQMA